MNARVEEKELVEAAVVWASTRERGTILDEPTLEAQFKVSYPISGSRAALERVRIRYVRMRTRFDHLLLNQHKMELRLVDGTTKQWRILHAHEHAERTEEILVVGFSRAIKRAKAVHKNTDTTALKSSAQQEAHRRAGAQVKDAATKAAAISVFAAPPLPVRAGRFAKSSGR